METIECVRSVLCQNYSNYNILVIDNGSANDSVNHIHKSFENDKRVTVIKTGRNYGFAKGNNIGICYAKRKWMPEYVMLLNSDTIMHDRDYIRKMITADQEGIGVIGSKIINPNNDEVYWSRYMEFPATVLYYLLIISIYKEHPLYRLFFERLLEKYERVNIIEGSAMLITPAYFQYYDYLDARTFLYCEEELLYLRCKKNGLEMKMNCDVSLYHKYGQSSQVLHTNKKKGFYKHLVYSYKYVVWESIKIFCNQKLFGRHK